MSDNQDLNKRFDELEKKLDGLALVNPLSTFNSPFSKSEEIDLRELWNVIWQGKWIIVGVTFVFAVASVIYALSLPNIYKSEALLAPAEENSGGGLSGSLGGLASLAGVSLGGGGRDETTMAVAILESREFLSNFIQEHDLMVPLFAVTGWDRGKDRLIIDEEIYDVENKKWVGGSNFVTPEPSLQEAHDKFRNIMKISKDKETNLFSLSVEHYSPTIAKSWVDLLVKDINSEMKNRDVLEANRSVSYLSGQLEKTSITEMQNVFYELIEDQFKKVMIAEVREEYAFKTVDSAIIPEKKTKPRKAQICILGTILGGGIGVLFVFVRYFSSKDVGES